jgi:hypothetical protein
MSMFLKKMYYQENKGGKRMKKILKISLCIFFLICIVSVTSEAASISMKIYGSDRRSTDSNTSKFTLNKGTRYYFNTDASVTVQPNTSSREVEFGHHLYWDRWYGQVYVGGKNLIRNMGNDTNKLTTYIYKYSFNHYINTTTNDFYFNYGQRGGSSNYCFSLVCKY